MKRRRAEPLPPFEFPYRDVVVRISPHDLDVLFDKININLYVDGELVELNREEQMRFIREYCAWLDS